MRLGMNQAMAELMDEAREPERQFDVEFGHDDEDPIERHVKLHLTPRKVPGFESLGSRRKRLEVGIEEDETMSDEEEAEILNLNSPMLFDNDGRGHFQPGLIHFRRSSRSVAIPAPFARSDTAASTPSSSTARSDASFEAIKADDYVSMYGGLDDRLSTIPSRTISSSDTVKSPPLAPTSRPSLLRPRPRAHPYPEGGRQREHSGEMTKIPNGGIEENEEDWLAGRTISETMVAKAGLRCQRGRTGRR